MPPQPGSSAIEAWATLKGALSDGNIIFTPDLYLIAVHFGFSAHNHPLYGVFGSVAAQIYFDDNETTIALMRHGKYSLYYNGTISPEEPYLNAARALINNAKGSAKNFADYLKTAKRPHPLRAIIVGSTTPSDS